MTRAFRSQTLSLISRDWAANSEPKIRVLLVLLRLTQRFVRPGQGYTVVGFAATALYRVFSELVIGLELRPKTRVGAGLKINHGFGLVVNDQSIIGEDVTLRHGVTLGHKAPGGPCPVIGDRVVVGAGAIILGGITIGDDAVVAAGSVVLEDVPPGATVAGNPARIVRRAGAPTT